MSQFVILKIEPVENIIEESYAEVESVSHTSEPGSLTNEELVNETCEIVVSDYVMLKPDDDVDWNETVDEIEYAAKCKPKRSMKPLLKKKPVQSEDELKRKERTLYTVIKIPPRSHVCCGCLQIFTCAEDLEVHRQTNHVWKKESLTKPSEKVLCNGCLRKYDSTYGVNRHKKRVRALKKIWECKQCNLRLKVPGKRREHLKTHTDDDHVTVISQFKENIKQELAEMIAHAHASHWIDKQQANLESGHLPEQCQVCYRRFSNKVRLTSHQRRVYRQKNMECPHCDEKFSSTVLLNRHELNEHGIGTVQCEICEKTYSNKYTLSKHIEHMHTNDNIHQCNVCGLTFRQSGGLKKHMLNHIDDREYECKICSKTFKAKLNLQHHMRIHTGERPYKCRYCDHAFAHHTNCRRHEMTHTGEKPHKCSRCDKAFILKRMLVEHEKSHMCDQ
ncbi:zinc finger protein 883-like [Armigeres subalbatus]|uniref:zinc finger protein 883-like n=1 Tax=Armigeres subalbatus TaxID=124917 RepID=UPI002ED4E8C3